MDNNPLKNGTAINKTSVISTKWSKLLLSCGVIAGPLYIAIGIIQILTRKGYDIRRQALSLLSNGELGWIQIANFIVSGLLVIACAVGIRKILHSDRSGTWGPLLLGGYGVGLIAAGIFVPDPALGFPPGTATGTAETVSSHGILHFVSGGIGFLSLIAACFVFARWFAASKQSGWAAFSIITGLIFFFAFLGISSGSGNSGINIAFTVAVVVCWGWISLMASKLISSL
jgi:hypothetical protein